MNCKNPLKLKVDDKIYTAQNLGYAVVPCGQCLNCRINQKRIWETRLTLEYLSHGDSVFVTLTYDEEHNPKILIKKDLQNYLKRLRSRLGFKFRYFAVGEYGSHTWRPHFHIILFGVSYAHSGQIKDSWSIRGDYLGHPEIGIHVGEVNSKSIRYILGYVAKKVEKKKDNDPRAYGYTDEFMCCSKGIGRDALKVVGDSLKKHELENRIVSSIKIGKRRVPLGRYLKRSLNLEHLSVSESDLKTIFRINQELFFEKCERYKFKNRRYANEKSKI